MNDLIRNLNDFVSENFPVDKVTPFLTDYDLKSDVIEKYCFFKDDKYSRNLVYKDEHFELLIVCWDSGQKAPIHGHEGEKCWMKVEKGSLQICNYQLKSMNPLSLTMIDRIDGMAGFLDGQRIFIPLKIYKTNQQSVSTYTPNLLKNAIFTV